MIELVSDDRCIRCDVCIRVCPTNVFEHGADRLPVIARQEECQTCFMCEAWCPTDALFVAPQTAPVAAGSVYRDEQALVSRGLLGSYRREIGWGDGITGRRLDYDTRGALTVAPTGLDGRRGSQSDQYDIGFRVAYGDEGEEE
jgi:NAD-dependent dihydropyrimidine dehydrogenase PreA subunit